MTLRLRRFASPERAAAEVTELRPAALKRIIERNRATNETVYTISSGNGDLDSPKLVHINAIDLEMGHTMLKRFRIGEEDPDGAQAEVILKPGLAVAHGKLASRRILVSLRLPTISCCRRRLGHTKMMSSSSGVSGFVA